MTHRHMFYALRDIAIWLRQMKVEPEQVTVVLRGTSSEVDERLSAALKDAIATAATQPGENEMVSGQSVCGLTISTASERPH